MRLALRFISGKYQGGEFPIEDGREIVVGRSSDLDMVLVEEMVSRKHARILLENDDISIEDMGSTNGTFVNGERIVKSKLKEGDRVLIGSNILKVVMTSAEDAAPHTRRAVQRGPSSSRPLARRGGESESRMSGVLQEIPLPDLLQLFGTSRKSGVLVIDTDADVGRIYLKEGVIHYVTLEDQSGELTEIKPLKAFYRMITWEHGSFELAPPDPKTFDDPMDASVQEVLMEGFRQRDEFEQIREKLPDLDSPLEVTLPLDAPLRDLDKKQLDVFQAVMNGCTLRIILDEVPLTDLDANVALVQLLDKAYVQKP